MLNFRPMMAVLTNIEEDHLDYYRDLKHLQETFQKFVGQVSGTVVVNADDPGSAVLTAKSLLTYGSSMSDATYAFTSRNIEIGMQRITTNIGHFELQIPGEFNVYNAMAATAAAMELGVPFATCAQVLKKFRGIWRRFERIGVWKGADIISDYGHHPSAIQQTVEATREFFPGRRIVLCYQPHQHDRTKKLFQEFVEVLPLADVTIVTEIFDVAGRNEGQDVSSRDVVEAINRSHRSNAIYASDLSAAQTQLCDLIQPRDIVLIMGAGDIDDVARRLV
jgi:UDP-N-acetylmuramate--alanine ligase